MTEMSEEEQYQQLEENINVRLREAGFSPDPIFLYAGVIGWLLGVEMSEDKTKKKVDTARFDLRMKKWMGEVDEV